MQIQIPLEQNWDSLDSAITYFKNVAAMLEAIKAVPGINEYFYLTIDPPCIEDWAVTLTNL